MYWEVHVLYRGGKKLLDPLFLGRVSVNYFGHGTDVQECLIANRHEGYSVSFAGQLFHPKFEMTPLTGEIVVTGCEPMDPKVKRSVYEFDHPTVLQVWVLTPCSQDDPHEATPKKRARR
jgi:hypothetical protein